MWGKPSHFSSLLSRHPSVTLRFSSAFTSSCVSPKKNVAGLFTLVSRQGYCILSSSAAFHPFPMLFSPMMLRRSSFPPLMAVAVTLFCSPALCTRTRCLHCKATLPLHQPGSGGRSNNNSGDVARDALKVSSTPSCAPSCDTRNAEKPVASSSPQGPFSPAATLGGVDYSEHRQQQADAAIQRQRTVQRATDAQRRGEEPLPPSSSSNISEEEKWWPRVNTNFSGRMFGTMLDPNKKRKDGMWTPEIKSVPRQDEPEQLSYASDEFFDMPDLHMADEALSTTKRFVPPPCFDPALDNVEEDNFTDGQVMADIQKALDEDKRRLEAFGNPLTVEDQVDYLLAPQREGDENIQQRQEFNGFTHWGLLHGAHMILEENHDFKRAHEFVNRYMRDIDLFTRWLEHPKVRGHIQKKFGVDMNKKFDKLMALTMAMYTRSKIQVYEDDASGALKSLAACVNMISEGADMKNERYRKALGAVLVARGMVYCKLNSYDRADDDLSRALAFVNAKRSATLFQLRAEAREALGRVEEAREDEVRAAEIWENAEVLHGGMDGIPRKFVV